MRIWLFVLVVAALTGAYLQHSPPGSQSAEAYDIYTIVLRSEIPKGMVYVHRQGDNYAAPSNLKREEYEVKFDPERYHFAMTQLNPEPQTLKSFEEVNWRQAYISPNFKDPTIHLLGQNEGTDSCIALLSQVGYNSNHSQALVSVNYEWSRMDYLLEKAALGNWTIARRCRGRGDTRKNKAPRGIQP
ncbi:MAG: hypothetical protein J0I12_12190 [Candidatus Eremiobacteraeota bacterium]|nr:hypothetical protein [Candidatus Eremiobacteraeota bacterium]